MTVFGVSVDAIDLRGLHHVRHHARDDRRRHAGAAHLEEGHRPALHDAVRIVAIDRARRADVRHQVRARRDDVGLLEAVVPGRSARAVPGHLVVVAAVRLLGVDGADGDRGGRVARRRDAGVARFARLGIAAEVAGRDDHDDALRDRVLHGGDQRIARRRLVDRMAQRHGDHLDAERGAIGRRRSSPR